MKNHTKVFALGTLMLATWLTSCNQTTEEVSPQQEQTQNSNVTLNTEEFRIVQGFVNAINANDRAAGLALVADQAGYAYSLTGTLNTGNSFRSWLESDLFGPRAVIQIQQVSQTGNVVRVQGRWGRNGNATNAADYHFTVENGLITSWRLV
jgi:SnoaL-like domain